MTAFTAKHHRRRAVVGPALVALGVLHVSVTAAVLPQSVDSILAGGVMGSIEADPAVAVERQAAFWYVTAGLGLVFTGWIVTVHERGLQPLPVALPVFLIGIGVWGVIMMPRSPFWAFLALGALAAVRGRRERRRSHTKIAQQRQRRRPPLHGGA